MIASHGYWKSNWKRSCRLHWIQPGKSTQPKSNSMATYLSSYKLFKREEDLMDIAGEVRMFCWGHQNIDYPLKTLRTAPYKNQLYSYLPHLIGEGRTRFDGHCWKCKDVLLGTPKLITHWKQHHTKTNFMSIYLPSHLGEKNKMFMAFMQK